MDVRARVQKVATQIESCSVQSVELHAETVHVVSASEDRLPLQIDDAARRADDDKGATVNQDTRLDNRVLDLRTPTNQVR